MSLAVQGPATPWSQAQQLEAFLAGMPALSYAEQREILLAASHLLADHYAHLPQKLANHGVDAPLLLRSFDSVLPHLVSAASFHAEIALRFAECRDLHTGYTLPLAFKDQIAFLPFQLASPGGTTDVIVAHVLPEVTAHGFKPGAMILSWNGVPIARAVELLALRSAGANPAAAWARGRVALTRRALQKSAPPDELWVEVGYRGTDGADRQARFEWRVGKLPGLPPGHGTTDGNHGLSLDAAADALRRHHDAVFADTAREPADGDKLIEEIASPLDILEAWRGEIDGRPFGYLRVRSFYVQDAAPFLAEVTRLLQALPCDGLILDVRDNSGGLVQAAEQMLQLFTKAPITPMDMQFLATQANLDLCRRQSPGSPDQVAGAPDLSPWVAGLAAALAQRLPWSDAHPMTRIVPWGEGDYAYTGPVVLITSALCYSACDIFIAGFRNNGLGTILGVDRNTGAGGANVLDLAHIMRLRGLPDALPQGVGLHLAFRRALHAGPDAGDAAGQPLEENGVEPNVCHDLTMRDLLDGDPDLIARAVALLRAPKAG